MIDPIKSNATLATYQSNGSSEPINQKLINQLIMASFLGHLDDKGLDKLKSLEPQMPGLKDLVNQLQDPRYKPQEVLTKITGAVTKAFIQSDPHMSDVQKEILKTSIDLNLEKKHDETYPSLALWSENLVAHIALNVPGLIPDGNKKGLEDLMNKIDQLDPSEKNYPSKVEKLDTEVAGYLALHIPGALPPIAEAKLNVIMHQAPSEQDDKKFPAEVSVWSARVHQIIEEAFFKN